MIEKEVIWPLPPKGHQKELFYSKTRFLIGCIGRQYGKTMNGLSRAYYKRIRSPGVHWWVSPTYAQARDVFGRAKLWFKELNKRPNESRMEIPLINGSLICFKSSDQPDNMRGPTLHSATMDECATQKSTVWPEIIRPMLAVNQGPCDFLGTPKGQNWFFDLWNHAAGREEWSRFQARSIDSPFFSEKEWEQIKSTTPERIFRQEYMAEFITDDSGVFKGIQDCIVDEISGKKYNPALRYWTGVDLARTQDYTVLTTINQWGEVVDWERFNQMSWSEQIRRVVAMGQRWRSTVVVDATGVGDAIFEQLNSSGVVAVRFQFTSTSKAQIINNLAWLIEREEVHFEEIPELVAELRMYEMEQTAMGNIRYNAPEGYHDDCVISLALACKDLHYQKQGAPAFDETGAYDIFPE